ncbi:hypothetical protein PTI98_009838 [Pleurotus ostreatus]|uniref:Uncharacterized protein n=1 Tax=Pleurotus cornucopiae TaxID=5321 RepID=A0ACB7J518_PLECO|nr:hypothetical protein CCMSSC00406_0001906 [Pleurotus cornucopiae]KAJ8692534.1 hypothetical protein PTI98_009838 [Pleurotus ostreatus]
MKWSTLLIFAAASVVSAQTYKRLGTCPSLGCIFPPDQTDFYAGAYFDIRLEVHSPVNGTEAFKNGEIDKDFTLCIQKGDGPCEDVTKFFTVEDSKLDTWTFSYYEDLFARDAGSASVVNVASKGYRALALDEPGMYTARLKYHQTMETVAHWLVREPAPERKAKNAIIFIGDGMTQPMITAARMIAHKSINGRYQSLMQMDQMEHLGHQMTHSIDSYITDSANSASALFTGHKTTSGALNVYVDSSRDSFDDPKYETVAELFRRKRGGAFGIVTTADVVDATPAAMCAHTRERGESAGIVYTFLNGASGDTGLNSSLAWPTSCEQPDVIFGGGAQAFLPGPDSPNGTDFYQAFAKEGYNIIHNNTQLQGVDIEKKTLGIFSKGIMSQWLDRHIYPESLKGRKNSPLGDDADALDQPGLKDMTLKAIDILQNRQKDSGKGWLMLSEGASIDKMMHALDYDRALGELLELDDTIRATIAHLKEIGELDNTLIVVTADHGHGFDVYGSVDTKYMAAQTDPRKKRDAIGIYGESGLSGYTVAKGSSPDNNTIVVGSGGPNFPVQWDPRYTFAGGMAAHPDIREGWQVNKTGIRKTVVSGDDGYVANPNDQPEGIEIEGTIPDDNSSGVHSLTDVSVFASGPGGEAFRGVYNSIDVFFKVADALGLGAPSSESQ